MGISEQIALVEREFVPGEILLAALALREGVSEFHAASWLLRQRRWLGHLPVVEFNRELRDFRDSQSSVAMDILDDICSYGEAWKVWTSDENDYVCGWMSSDLREFFAQSDLDFPESEINKLQRNNPSPIAIKAATTEAIGDAGIDPIDLPDEMQLAGIAYRAVINGYGDRAATFKNRLIDYLEKTYTDLKSEAVKRIATVANPDKTTGRKRRDRE